MSPVAPIYTRKNCAVAYQLNWSYTLFWNNPSDDHNWFPDLQAACEIDSVRLLQHEFKPPNISQFLVSTTPAVHVVFGTEERWREIRHDALVCIRDMIESASERKGHLLRRAGLLPDHVHLTLGCDPNESPEEVALSYMNNLAYAQGMSDVFRYSYFAGTFGEYDLGVIPRSAP